MWKCICLLRSWAKMADSSYIGRLNAACHDRTTVGKHDSDMLAQLYMYQIKCANLFHGYPWCSSGLSIVGWRIMAKLSLIGQNADDPYGRTTGRCWILTLSRSSTIDLTCMYCTDMMIEFFPMANDDVPRSWAKMADFGYIGCINAVRCDWDMVMRMIGAW